MSSGDGILVLYERGRRGAAALAEGARLARGSGAALSVLALAPQDTDPAVCCVYTEAFNEGVRSAALDELAEARRLLGEDGLQARYVLLLGGRDASLEEFVADGSFDPMLLARPRALGLAARRRARRLAQISAGELRLISA